METEKGGELIMKLNPDCVRATMLAIESFSFGEECRMNELMGKPEVSGYSEDDVQYTCRKLLEAGYIKARTIRPLRSPELVTSISDLTYAGHEFLNTIRAEKNWAKVKSTAKAAGVFSLKGLHEIGLQVAAAAITSALQQIL